MQLGLFRRCAFAKLRPSLLDEVLVKLCDLPHGQRDTADAPGVAQLGKKLVEYGLCGFKFAHVIP